MTVFSALYSVHVAQMVMALRETLRVLAIVPRQS